MRVVICGGGVIGASLAYFLSRRGVKATVIESTKLACAASGKSGGFLARDWCDGSPLAPLARRSFALHAQLAASIAEGIPVDLREAALCMDAVNAARAARAVCHAAGRGVSVVTEAGR